MNATDAEKVIEIMSHADGGCSHCVSTLFQMFEARYPQYTYLLTKQWHADDQWGDWRNDDGCDD